MLRIPNASPSGLFTNFETKCSEYFHPRVLVYILRNKAAYLARNSSILNPSFPPNSFRFSNGITNPVYDLHTSQNVETTSDFNNYRSSKPSKKLEDDLMLLSCSLISCANCIQPQSVATILLSFAKLNYFDKEVFYTLLDSFKFESAKPKSVSLVLYALSKCPRASDMVSTNFFRKIEEYMEITLPKCSTHDLTTYLISIAKLRDVFLKNIGHHDAVDSLRNMYNMVLNHIVHTIKNEVNTMESQDSSEQDQPSSCSFSVFELSNILESLYIMKHYNHRNHGIILDQLQIKLPYSINYIDDVLYIMNLFNINPKNPTIKKEDRTNIIRLNKRFCENILNDLTDKLGLFSIHELSRLTKVINKLRLWTEDHFIKSYTNSFMRMFKNYKGVMDMGLLLPILLYYNRRYESSINREYYQSHVNKDGKGEFMRNLNEISDLCGYVCDVLHDYISTNYPSQSIDDLLKFTSKLRTNRSLHRMKYNYKFSEQ